MHVRGGGKAVVEQRVIDCGHLDASATRWSRVFLELTKTQTAGAHLQTPVRHTSASSWTTPAFLRLYMLKMVWVCYLSE